jgi:hypothetical protein
MKSLVMAAVFLAITAGGAAAQTSCPASRTVVDIHGSTNPATRTVQRDLLIASVQQPDTIVRLGPDVDFDFSDVTSLPIQIGRCTTLTSVADFDSVWWLPGAPAEARSAHAVGPVLRYGKHPDLSSTTAFFQTTCGGDLANDGVRISGFRLFGPSFGDQTTDEAGLRIEGCHDTEVSNMEIAGWGGAGIDVRDLAFTDIPPSEPKSIGVLIHDSYFHDNRHPTEGGDLGGLFGGHAEGYGVVAGQGAFMRVFNSVFDNNRHAVAASGNAGGYHAERNLILRGGGYHGAWYEAYTHVMDAHGTGCWWSSDQCGDAGRSFLIKENVFQYTRNHDIHIRGNPRGQALIDTNIFARSDEGAAIEGADNGNVVVRGNNTYNVNDFGHYDVCDFDGDGVDDLFFATGVTWWFSGQGRFPWTFLSADALPRRDLRFGYFDGDQRCDVLAELPTGSGQWFISSGGVTDPFKTQLGSFGHPLSEVVFGRFDPSIRDHRPGVTRQTTHAFWRRDDGQWFVTPLNMVAWTPVQSSSFPLNKLQFGDFTGDGVTDVLAVVNGHWAISESARGTWRQINTLGDPVETLMVANMDADDNIDDLLKLDRNVTLQAQGPVIYQTVKLTWWRSKNAVEPWKVWKTYTLTYPANDDGYVPAGYAFAGRLGPGAGGGATMIIDENRMGNFTGGGGRVNWQSLAPY